MKSSNFLKRFFIQFLESDRFVVIIAIILFFSSSLDIGITNYILREYPEKFYEREIGILAKNFLDTEKWWIFSVGNSLGSTFILLGAYFFNPTKDRFKDLFLIARSFCLYFSLLPLWFVYGWWKLL